MAQQITRLLPDQTINPHDVINRYALDAKSGEAGTFVKVLNGDFSNDPVRYVNRTDLFKNSLGNAISQYPEVPYKVVATSGTGDAGLCIGMIMNDVREVDENGENLHYYPQKRAELQCVVSGEAVPIATRGIVTVNTRALAGAVVPSVGHMAVLSTLGKVTGVAYSALSTEQKNAVVGKFIGTGNRESQQNTDAFAGAYAVLQFSL